MSNVLSDDKRQQIIALGIDLISCLVADAVTRRGDRLLDGVISPLKTLDNFDLNFSKKMNRSLVFDLATANFIGRREDALFLGPPGSGKSHLAQAIGQAAISQGYIPKTAGRGLIVWCIGAAYNFLVPSGGAWYLSGGGMYITIDERDRRPIYQQVVDGIKALIARSELRQGSTLPPVRQVAADLGVNLNTIAFAYRQLQREGLIKVKHGSGAEVISSVLAKRDEERAHDQLQAVLTDLVLSGFTKSEVLALVNNVLNSLGGERNRPN